MTDLQTKVNELFAQISEQLEPQLQHLQRSGCGIDDDDKLHGEYLVARAFLCAFMDDQVYRMENRMLAKPEFHKLFENYSKFL
jgi:hypothetical protein